MYQQNKISTWAVEDRPSEKMALKGVRALTNAEVLSIIIGAGNKRINSLEMAKRMLGQDGLNLHLLPKLSIEALCSFEGITKTKAVRLLAAFELNNRRYKEVAAPQIKSSLDIMSHFCFLQEKPYEEFWLLLLTKANRIIKKVKISQGSVSGTVVDIKLIMKNAIENLASAIIIVHNHPSKNTKPSDADINLTKKIQSACSVMDVTLLDHLIIAGNEYYSFCDKELLTN